MAPSAATLAGAPRSAAVGDGWAQGAAVGFPALVPPSAGCDPRTAPTVGGGVGGLGFGGGGPGGDGLLALGESVTMPGWSDVSRSFRSKGGRAREGGGESEKPRGRVCVGWRECGCVVCSCEYLQLLKVQREVDKLFYKVIVVFKQTRKTHHLWRNHSLLQEKKHQSLPTENQFHHHLSSTSPLSLDSMD